MTGLPKIISEAHESNAGDDFHKLWAAKRALDLLNFDELGLKKLVVEGISSEDVVNTAENGEKLLAVDLTEYFGGKEFLSAEEVVLAQLKYSTRRSDLNYTAARLCEKKNGKQSGAILTKLANAFQVFLKEYGREKVLAKLVVKLISNRPIEKEFYQQIQSVQKHLAAHPNKTSKHQLQKHFPKSTALIEKLFKASGLGSYDFVDFLRVLDFTECGVGARFKQRQELIRSLSKFSRASIEYRFHTLHTLINNLMMPENRNSCELILEDLIMEFKLGVIENLFPVPPKFERPKFRINRTFEREMAQKIADSSSQLFLFHGAAGIGKSTFITGLKQNLPRGSKTIEYDCFGQGEYLNSDQMRHLPSNAFLQISNELAKEVGTDLLLEREQSNHLYIQDFKERAANALQVMRDADPNALLVIIIDAADNSITAAREKGQQSFVHALLQLGHLPVGCCLIFTSRTSRINLLNPSEQVQKEEIQPFECNESGFLLSHYFPEASADEIKEFHTLTKGIPRVQHYALQSRSTLPEVFEYLKPYGKSVGSLIEGQLKDATRRLGEPDKVRSILSALISLPRPIPLDYAAQLSQVNPAELKDFCIDLSSGIVGTDSELSFRDEDFENHIADHYSPALPTYEKLAAVFLEKAEEDKYAALHLGEVLYKAQYYEQLQQIVIEDQYLSILKDPLIRREVFVHRTQLALSRATITQNTTSFFQLLSIAAKAAKSNAAQLKIIKHNIGLVIRFSGVRTIQKKFLDGVASARYGAANWECASALALNADTRIFAEKHLQQARRWLIKRERVRKEDEEEMKKYPIENSDISAGAQAVLYLKGFNAVNRWLRMWSPKEIMPQVISSFVKRVVFQSEEQELARWFSQIPRLDIKVIAFNESFKTGSTYGLSAPQLLNELAHYLHKGCRFDNSFNDQLISICEIGLRSGADPMLVIEILQSLNIETPEHRPYFYGVRGDDSLEKMDSFFRYKCLLKTLQNQHIELEDFYPASITKILASKASEDENEIRRAREKKAEFNKIYREVLPLYKFRAEVVNPNLKGKKSRLALAIIDGIENNTDLRYRRHDYSHIRSFIYTEIIGLSNFVKKPGKYLNRLYGRILSWEKDQVRLKLELAQKSALVEKGQDLTYKVLNQLHELLLKEAYTASDKVGYFESCARICQSMKDYKEAEVYFNQAVEVAKEIDYEAMDQVKALYRLAETLPESSSHPKLAYEINRFVEYSNMCLGDHEHFPWHFAISAIQQADFNFALSIWCKWDHRNVEIDGDTSFYFWSETLKKALQTNKVSPAQAIGLSTYYLFDHDWLELADLILERLIAEKDDAGCDQYLKLIEHDITVFCPLGSRKEYIKLLIPVFEKHGLQNNSWCKKLVSLLEFLSKDDKKKPSSNVKKHKQPKNQFLKDLGEACNPLDPTSLNNSLEQIKRKEKEEGYYHIRDIDFFKALRKKCSPTQATQFLDSILNIKSGLLSDFTFREILEDSFKKWSNKQELTVWKEENFSRAVEKLLFEIDHGYRGDDDLHIWSLNNLADLFSKSDIEVALTLQQLLPQLLPKLNTSSIYQLFGYFKHLIKQTESYDLLEWFVVDLNQNTPEDASDGIWSDNLKPPKETPVAYAEVIRYYLGHPEKSYRWNALNSVLRAVDFGDYTLLDTLIQHRNQTDIGVFQHKTHVYFWLSAKVWLYVGLDKIASHNPRGLVPFLDSIYKDALQSDNNHVLIRSLAKSVVDKIFQYDKNLLTKEEHQSLQKVLLGKEEDQGEELKNTLASVRPPRFSFDTYDTESYWYRDLARLFGLKAKDISKLADRFISSYLGFTENPIKKNHVKLPDREYDRFSNYHGQIPEVENVKTYFEFHAMFLVANQLIESVSLVKTESENDNDQSWKYWLEKWGLTWDNKFWLHDLRDPTPQEERYWKWVNPFGSTQEWKYGIDSNYLDHVAGVENFSKVQLVKVFGREEVYADKCTEKVHLKSALVSQQTAHSLVRALQTADNCRDYGFPWQTSDDFFWQSENQFEIDYEGFKLMPFLNQLEANTCGIDDTDKFSKELMKIKVLPSDAFIDFNKGKVSLDDRYVRSSTGSEVIISRFENWSDYTLNYDYRSGFGSNGGRLLVNKQRLLAYLKKMGRCLIMKCEVERDVYYEKWEKDELEDYHDYNYSRSYLKIYLVTPDGKIRTYRGDSEVG